MSSPGIIKRFNLTDKEDTVDSHEMRLRNLSALQCKLLEHASKFPNVKRIVYSTCSIHAEENESVVKQTLENIGSDFQLEKAIPSWLRRGLDTYDDSTHNIGVNCVRVDAREDMTNGFFVAAFVRR